MKKTPYFLTLKSLWNNVQSVIVYQYTWSTKNTNKAKRLWVQMSKIIYSRILKQAIPTLICLFRLDDWLKLLPHTIHLWGLCFSCTWRICIRNLSFFSNDLAKEKRKVLKYFHRIFLPLKRFLCTILLINHENHNINCYYKKISEQSYLMLPILNYYLSNILAMQRRILPR